MEFKFQGWKLCKRHNVRFSLQEFLEVAQGVQALFKNLCRVEFQVGNGMNFGITETRNGKSEKIRAPSS